MDIPKVTIHIVEVGQNILDLSTVDEDALQLALTEIVKIPKFSGLENAINSFTELSRNIKKLSAFNPEEIIIIGDGEHRELSLSLAIRTVLLNPSIRPILSEQKTGSSVRVRPSTRIKAITHDLRDISIAPEDEIYVSGFAVDVSGAGLVVFDNLYTSSQILAPSTFAYSGLYTSPMFASIISPDKFQEYPEGLDSQQYEKLTKKGFKIFTDLEIVPKLYAQTRAAIDYIHSGYAAVETTRTSHDMVTRLMREKIGTASSLSILSPDSGLVISKQSSTTWRRQSAMDKLINFLERLSKTEQIATKETSPSLTYDLNPLFDLHRVGALDVYMNLLSEGRESITVKSFVELLKIRSSKTLQLKEIKKSALDFTSKARAYATIVEEKFGYVRFQAILNHLRNAVGIRTRGAPGGSMSNFSENVQINNPDAVLEILSPQEQTMVKTEYANRVKEWESMINNKCPHVQLLKTLQKTTNAKDTTTILDKLTEFYSEKTRNQTDDWIICKQCNFRVICPHLNERLRMEISRTPYEQIRTKLSIYAIKVRSDSENGDNYAHYCRICSGKVAEYTDGEQAPDEIDEQDTSLRHKIWAISIAASRRVRFPIPTNEKQFASAVSFEVLPLILALDNDDSKRRKKLDIESDEESPRTVLWIVLYVYAYILSLINSTRGIKSQEIGLENVSISAKDSAYADQMIKIISTDYRGIISQLTDISIESIRSEFASAYKSVRSSGKIQVQTIDPEEDLAIQMTTLDPIYGYALNVAKLSGDLPIVKSQTPQEARKDFETVVGNTLPGVVSDSRKYAKDPEYADYYSRSDRIGIPSNYSFDFLVKNRQVSLYSGLYELKGSSESLESLEPLPIINDKANSIRTWTGGSRSTSIKPSTVGNLVKSPDPLSEHRKKQYFDSYRLFIEYTKHVTDYDKYNKYLDALAIAKESSNAIRLSSLYKVVKPYYTFKSTSTIQYTPDEGIDIEDIYDEDGNHHEWSIYVYKNKDSKVIELLKPSISSSRSSRSLIGFKLVDMRCSVCNVLKTEAHTLSKEKVQKSLEIVSEIDTFISFYDARCPEGNLHNYTGNTCTKCGYYANATDKDKRAYHNKYFSKYKQERDSITQLHKIITNEPIKREPSTDYSEYAKNWKYNYADVISCAKLANVSSHTIEAIGSMEQRDYLDINAGNSIPVPPTSMDDHRIHSANSEVVFLLSESNKLCSVINGLVSVKNSSSIVMNALSKSPRVPSKGNERKNIPQNMIEYHEKFEAIKKSRPPQDVYIFIIGSLCEFIITMSTIHDEFAKMVLIHIVRNQKLMSKPGKFNWAVFDSEVTDSVEEEVGDIGEDVMEENLGKDQEEEDPENPYSSANMDYDNDEDNPNNEPP